MCRQSTAPLGRIAAEYGSGDRIVAVLAGVGILGGLDSACLRLDVTSEWWSSECQLKRRKGVRTIGHDPGREQRSLGDEDMAANVAKVFVSAERVDGPLFR